MLLILLLYVRNRIWSEKMLRHSPNSGVQFLEGKVHFRKAANIWAPTYGNI